jgi:hypothetical protein
VTTIVFRVPTPAGAVKVSDEPATVVTVAGAPPRVTLTSESEVPKFTPVSVTGTPPPVGS